MKGRAEILFPGDGGGMPAVCGWTVIRVDRGVTRFRRNEQCMAVVDAFFGGCDPFPDGGLATRICCRGEGGGE